MLNFIVFSFSSRHRPLNSSGVVEVMVEDSVEGEEVEEEVEGAQDSGDLQRHLVTRGVTLSVWPVRNPHPHRQQSQNIQKKHQAQTQANPKVYWLHVTEYTTADRVIKYASWCDSGEELFVVFSYCKIAIDKWVISLFYPICAFNLLSAH